jgi:ATP-dependent Clp protease protease subunit
MIDLDQWIRDASKHRHELEAQGFYFLGDINDDAAFRFSQSLVLMAQERAGNPDTPITVYINSGGGGIGAGIAIMEMMYKMRHELGVTINTVVTGYAYSMGAVIFQGGQQRFMGAYSTLMLHSPQWTIAGNDQRIFTDYAVLAEHYQNLVANLFAERTGKHDAAWWENFIYSGRDRFLTARECLDLGLADGLYDGLPLLPPFSPNGPAL